MKSIDDYLGDLILKAFVYFVKYVTHQAIDWLLTLIIEISEMAKKVFELDVVQSAITYSQILAGSILILKVAYEAFMTYIMRLDGDPDADPGGLLIRTARAAAVIGCVPWLVTWILQFGTVFSKDVAQLDGMDLTQGVQELDVKFEAVWVTAEQYVLFIGPIILIAIVIVILVFLQTFVRAAELAMIAVSGAFMALGLTNPDNELFRSWWKELLYVSLSQVVQLFMIKASFFTLTDAEVFGNVIIVNVLMFASFLWVAYKSPAVLKQYMYSSGVTRAAAGATRSVASMTIMRKVFTRGV